MGVVRLATCAVAAAGLILRRDGPPSRDGGGDSSAEADYELFKKPEITEKYDKLETVNEVLFMIACRAKHHTDVKGAAKEKVKERLGSMDTDEFMKEVEIIQKENVVQMKESCGFMSSKGWKKCRESCTARFAAGGADSDSDGKVECTNLCEKKYKSYEQECIDQTENLQNVYDVERGTMTGGSKCSNLHCPDYPNVVMQSDEAKAKEELEKSCAGRCDKSEKEGCAEKCKESCNVSKLRTCAKDLTKNFNITTEYCTQLWQWLYDSEAIDAKTGNPLVLLGRN